MPINYLRPVIILSLLQLVFNGNLPALLSLPIQQPARTEQETKNHREPISSHIILVSISGLRSDFATEAARRRARIPAIQSLLKKGSHAVGIESVFPSLSNPAHASIITGTLPADHGITSDAPLNKLLVDRPRTPHSPADTIKSDAIWDVTKRANLVTAAVGFPLTEGASIDLNLPVVVQEFDDQATQTGTRSYSTPPNLRNEVLSALSAESKAGKINKKVWNHIVRSQDLFKASASAYLIKKYRPNLLLVNFTSFEMVQRKFGVLSDESIASIELIDEFIGQVVAAATQSGLGNDTTFILVSDSGAARVEREFRPNVALARKGFLEVGDNGRIVSWRAVAQGFGGSAAIFLRDPQEEGLAREVEAVFREQFEKPDSPIWRIISKRDAARLGADPQASFYLDAAPSNVMTSSAEGSMITGAGDRAARGHSPSRSEMRSAFIISGKGVKAGAVIEYARLIDIAPTISNLFGLEMKTARGRVLKEVFEK
jgi:predicted AlkP superfamily pyrophosphatase or phosphodiesterase